MKTFVQPGERITYAHTAAVTSGTPVKIGTLLGVPVNDGAANVEVEYSIRGVHKLPKVTADVIAIGAQLYWDDAAKKLTVTAGANTTAGRAFKAATGTDTEVLVLLNNNG